MSAIFSGSNERNDAMNRIYRTAAALIMTLLLPSAAFADLRRVELKVLGMD